MEGALAVRIRPEAASTAPETPHTSSTVPAGSAPPISLPLPLRCAAQHLRVEYHELVDLDLSNTSRTQVWD